MEKRKGREYVDPTPVEWPLGVGVPESLEQKMARMIRTSVSQFASSQGAESFDEADDFDVEDPEGLPESQHELDDDQERIMADQRLMRQIPREFRDAYEREIARIRQRNADRKDSVEIPTGGAEQAPPGGGKVAPT